MRRRKRYYMVVKGRAIFVCYGNGVISTRQH